MFLPNQAITYADILPATFTGQINGVECQLTLHLVFDRLTGSFQANGEHLEVEGGIPNEFGEVFGLMFSYSLEPIAVFQTNLLGASSLEWCSDPLNPHAVMGLEHADQVVFTLIPTRQDGLAKRHEVMSSNGLRLEPWDPN
jgi:hypothetical protein